MQTTEFAPAIAQAVGLIGRKVTYRDQQWNIHSIEGLDWYAHESADDKIVVDTDMTPLTYLVQPRVMIHPVGTKIGEGFGAEIDLKDLVRLPMAPLEA